MKTSATNRRIHQLLTAIGEKRLNPRPDFQRRLVWTNDDKLNFLSTVLRELPFPEIYVCAGTLDPDTGVATEFLVDGQQRITTLHQYFKANPSLRLGKGIRPYSELSTESKERFLEYEVVVRDLGKHDLQNIREIFELINSANYALNTIEVKNARYAGEFKKFCERVADRQEFKDWKIFKLNDIRRMQDLRYCLVLVATMMSTYFNRDEDIEEYLKRYNDTFPDKEQWEGQINASFRFVNEMNLPPESRAFRKTDLFSLLVELRRALFARELSIEPAKVAERLSAFFAEVDRAAATNSRNRLAIAYYRSTVRAAIDRANRLRRGEILQGIIDPAYSPNLRLFGQEEKMDGEQQQLDFVEEGDY